VASTFAQPDEKGDLRKMERTLSINMKRFRVRANPNGATQSVQSA
jgi:hypothetical protein